jgi:hypothetical protein
MKRPDLVFPDFVPKPTPKPTKKDCVLEYYNCTNYSYETIQIDMDADCYAYQPAKPNCMKRSDDLVFLEPIDFDDLPIRKGGGVGNDGQGLDNGGYKRYDIDSISSDFKANNMILT